jgi:hypothetical protein
MLSGAYPACGGPGCTLYLLLRCAPQKDAAPIPYASLPLTAPSALITGLEQLFPCFLNPGFKIQTAVIRNSGLLYLKFAA